jgi:outer membrane receptor protein involved in Fe transport
MVVVYDNPSLFEFNGEVFWQKSDKMKLSARADYLGYSADVQQKPWHIPSLRLSVAGAYKIKDKIKLSASVHSINRQFARVITSDTLGLPNIRQEELKGIVDVNVGAEYRYSKRIGMFLQLNNILNTRYYRYMHYPLQRFNALGGITLSF